jgi:hypothetical protein
VLGLGITTAYLAAIAEPIQHACSLGLDVVVAVYDRFLTGTLKKKLYLLNVSVELSPEISRKQTGDNFKLFGSILFLITESNTHRTIFNEMLVYETSPIVHVVRLLVRLMKSAILIVL